MRKAIIGSRGFAVWTVNRSKQEQHRIALVRLFAAGLSQCMDDGLGNGCHWFVTDKDHGKCLIHGETRI
jgi:hypothetical protein